jgi:hypothetical protein
MHQVSELCRDDPFSTVWSRQDKEREGTEKEAFAGVLLARPGMAGPGRPVSGGGETERGGHLRHFLLFMPT